MTRVTRENFKIWQYPGGERGVTLLNIDSNPLEINLIWRICNSNDLIDLLLAVDAIKYAYPQAHLKELIIPYLPYARQDKRDGLGVSFSLKIITQILDNIGFHLITCYDVHSSVAAACFNKTNFYSKAPTLAIIEWMHNVGMGNKSITVISPDQGAVKRASAVADATSSYLASFNKIRDPRTGEVTKCELAGALPTTLRYLVVDDICDGGATFIEVAQKLQLHKEQMFLFTTHGIYSKGFDELRKHYSIIGSTDSYSEIPETDFYKRIKII